MALPFDFLSASRWLVGRSSRSGHPAGGALLVMVIIAVSLCLGVLRVVDVAVSGALQQLQAPISAAATSSSYADLVPATGEGSGGASATEAGSAAIAAPSAGPSAAPTASRHDCVLVVPSASVDAVML